MVMEADMGLTNMAMEGRQGRYLADDTLAVRFFSHPRQNEAKSQEEGRPIFEDVDYIEIMQPGNKDSIVRRPATPMDIQRFARHYEAYKARTGEEILEGTPLKEWGLLTGAQCAELEFMNIKTVEQLAGVSDSNAQNMLGVMALRQKAQDYLEASKESATIEALAEAKRENEKLQETVAELAQKVELLSEMQSAPKKTRGKKAAQE